MQSYLSNRTQRTKMNTAYSSWEEILFGVPQGSVFYEFLEKDGFVSIHKLNLRFLACDMFKLRRGTAPELIKELILPNRQHRFELQNNPDFVVPLVKSVHKVT